MAEILKPVAVLPEGIAYIPGPGEYIITEQNTIADCVRWLVEVANGTEDIRYLLGEIDAQRLMECV